MTIYVENFDKSVLQVLAAVMENVTTMKMIRGVLIVAWLCCACRASNAFSQHFKRDLRDEKVGSMLTLIQAIKRHPQDNTFHLSFQSYGSQSVFRITVRYDKRARKLYLWREQMGWNRSLTLYRNVTLQKIQRAYHRKQRESLSSDDNFDLLSEVGCPETVIARKVFSVNGPDRD